MAWRATPRTRSSACGRRWTWCAEVSRHTDLRRVGLALHRAVPVPRGAHALVLGRRRAGRSTTASAARRAATRSGSCRRLECAGLPRGGRAAGRALRRGADARARGPAGGGAPPASRAPAEPARAHRLASTRTICGSRPRRRGRASTWPAAGSAEEVLRAFRVGYAPKAWDRVLVGARRDGFTPRRAAGRRARAARSQRQPARPLPRADHVPARRRPRAGAGLRRARDARRAGRRSTSTLPRTSSTTRAASCSGSTAREARSPRRAGPWSSRATPTCWPCTAAGLEETVGIMGTAVTQEQLAELARAVGEDGTVYLALDADSSGQEAMLRAARIARGARDRAAGGADARGQGPRRPGGCSRGPMRCQERLADAISVLEFEVGRVLADGDLDSPEGRDRALMATRRAHRCRTRAQRHAATISCAWSPTASTFRRTTWLGGGAGRDRLATRSADPRPRPEPRSTAPWAAEQVYLALCLASGPSGREALEASRRRPPAVGPAAACARPSARALRRSRSRGCRPETPRSPSWSPGSRFGRRSRRRRGRCAAH